jgi:hypothetical protein
MVENPKEGRPLRRLGHGFEGNIKMNITGIRWSGMDWIHLGQDRDQWKGLVNMVMNIQVK